MKITAWIAGEELVVEVCDDGVGLGGRADGLIREGHSLGNVSRRLKTLYRRGGVVELLPGPSGRGAIARLHLPLPVKEAAVP